MASAPARRVLPLLATANFAAATAGMIIAGILQLIAADLGWSAPQAGHLITVYALAFAVGAPLLGAALGRRCRKQVVVAGLALVALGSLASALASGSPALELARIMVAAGAAMTIPGVSAIASYLYPDDRPRALAAVLMGMTTAIVLGVPMGTFAAGLFGWHAPLAGAALLAAAAALAIKRLLPGGIVVPPVALATWAALLADGRTYRLLLVPLLFVASTFSLYAYIAAFLLDTAGVGAQSLSWLLLLFGVVSLLANGVLGRVSRAIGDRPLMLVSGLLLAVTLGTMALTGGRMWLVGGLFASWALATSFFNTLQQARIAAAAPRAGPALLALNTSASFAGQAFGALVGGGVVAVAGLHALPWAGVALALAATFACAAWADVVLEP